MIVISETYDKISSFDIPLVRGDRANHMYFKRFSV